MMGIFRKEAVEYQSEPVHGEIIIPVSTNMLLATFAGVVLFLLILLFMIFGSYTRKAQLSGIVMPSSGLIKITPQYNGYVTKLTVSEGQHIQAGETLYYISGERYDGHGSGTLASMNLSLQAQFRMLTSEQELEARDNIQQQQAIRQKINAYKPQIISAEQRLMSSEQQVELARSVMHRYKQLTKTHYVSDIEYQQKQIDVSTAQQNFENQRQLLLQLHAALEGANDDLNHLIVQGERHKSELDRQLQEIRQQQNELSGQENFTLAAPMAGTVGAVLIKQGQPVKASEPVMTLVPDDANIQIELYATSQKTGFLRPGQRVALRFTAFPYQKFGVQYGTIREISRTTIMSSDLLSISPVTWKENEGHYRIIVEPENTFILAYGKKESLRPGMTLEGDVNLDTRHLWEWLTEPLWSLKGKL